MYEHKLPKLNLAMLLTFEQHGVTAAMSRNTNSAIESWEDQHGKASEISGNKFNWFAQVAAEMSRVGLFRNPTQTNPIISNFKKPNPTRTRQSEILKTQPNPNPTTRNFKNPTQPEPGFSIF
jgi:hypothetical protein